MTKTKRSTPNIELPKRMRPSEEELVLVSRLVRVMRERQYWLGAFIEYLLQEDSELPIGEALSLDIAENALKDFKAINTWTRWVDKDGNRKKGAPMLRYAQHNFFPDSADNSMGDKLDDVPDSEYCDLVKLWRLEHPEPPKRPTFPKGRTQHDMDPDSD